MQDEALELGVSSPMSETPRAMITPASICIDLLSQGDTDIGDHDRGKRH